MMLLSLLITLCGCSKNSGGDSYMQISVNDAIEMMETEKDYIILDVRTIAEYKEGHIPGAICVPNEANKLPQSWQSRDILKYMNLVEL